MSEEETKQLAERIVSALEGNFRDWLMPGEYQEAIGVVLAILKEKTKP